MHDDREEFIRERQRRLEGLGADDPVWGTAREFFDATIPLQYSYNFDWLGVPIIQYPQDIVAMQELIWRVKPDLIVETGVARGGSLILYASLLKLLGNGGKVVGVDIDIRPHNRDSIESHPLGESIVLIEGSSVGDDVVDQVRRHAEAAATTMVVLDSHHTKDHVAGELELYSPLVRRGSYLVVFDTVVEYMTDEAVAERPWGKGNSPLNAVEEFLETTDRFAIDRSIDAKLLISVAPSGYLECVKDPE
jgi:cephalosporin hydroxylase